MTVEEYAYSMYEQCVAAGSTSRVSKKLQAAEDAEDRSIGATGGVGMLSSGSGNGKSHSRDIEFTIAETIWACQKALRLYAGDGLDEQEVSSTLPDFSCLRL